MHRLFIPLLIALLPIPALAEQTAILPIKFLDTSGEARDQQDQHQRRLDILAGTLRDELGNAVLIDAASTATCQPQTTDCLLALGRDAGGDRTLFVVAQKTSTLILQLFANLVDTESGTLIRSRNLNFRGDNDDAWRRAGRFLAGQMRDASN
ncbi:DUF2380 domain-containing protein [Paracoccus salsus]|uniref:DUF2380 domain-containing protein n=1 Tax=Paracoccus salsus TaxID=2911061 RepID=UPI001F3DF342|nr:DUF2380 domain-containing protein [Paracoccus salsus]MCF3973087.1 DUF3280 domain-containing protein [Paracoccus salsus]